MNIGLTGMWQRRLRTDVDHVGAIAVEHLSTGNRLCGGRAHAFVIPRIGGEIHDANEVAIAVEVKQPPAEGKGTYGLAKRTAILLQQGAQHVIIEHRVLPLRLRARMFCCHVVHWHVGEGADDVIAAPFSPPWLLQPPPTTWPSRSNEPIL